MGASLEVRVSSGRPSTWAVTTSGRSCPQKLLKPSSSLTLNSRRASVCGSILCLFMSWDMDMNSRNKTSATLWGPCFGWQRPWGPYFETRLGRSRFWTLSIRTLICSKTFPERKVYKYYAQNLTSIWFPDEWALSWKQWALLPVLRPSTRPALGSTEKGDTLRVGAFCSVPDVPGGDTPRLTPWEEGRRGRRTLSHLKRRVELVLINDKEFVSKAGSRRKAKT
jgi:hypothetical protein